jgi:small subunit ribosomal protein S20
MPITTGAKKTLRGDKRKAVHNLRRSRALKSVIKEIEDLVKAGKGKEAKELLPKAYKTIDKAAKMNTIKENTAARKKSRLSRIIKEASI